MNADLDIGNLPDYFAPGWNRQRLGQKTFDELFQIEGIPLSWFLQRLLSQHTIPKELQRDGFLEKLSERATILLNPKRFTVQKLRHLYFLNEQAKIMLSQKKGIASNAPILFLTYLDHINQQGEIYRLSGILHELQLPRLVVAVSPTSEKVSSFVRKKHNTTLLYSFITKKIKKKSSIIAHELAKQWSNLREEEKQSIFPTASIWHCFQPIFEFYLSYEFLYFIVLYFETWKSLLMQQQIKVGVTTSQHSIFERCLMAAAHLLKIPTVLIQHGAGMGAINPGLLEPYKIAVFSADYKKLLVEKQVPAKNVVVTGPIIFDEIYPFVGNSGKSLYKINRHKTEKHPSKKSLTILILTVPFVEQGLFTNKEYFTYIKKMLWELQHYSVIIKPHPREKFIDNYFKIIQHNNFTHVTVIPHGQTPLYELMSASDVIVNFSSTTALEAMILDKLLITVLFDNFHNPFNAMIHESNASLEVSIDDDFGAALERLQTDKKLRQDLRQNRRRFAAKVCGKVDGKAGERVARLIEEISRPKDKE